MNDIQIREEFVPLNEAMPRADGTLLIKIIQPGWGSSGYYSEALLQNSVQQYHSGLHNFWNHQTEAEMQERPERDLRDLASVQVEDAWYDPNGPQGPGLYSRVKPFSQYTEAITEMAPYIGMSHVALGKAKEGEADGRKGPIIESISQVRSVDYVTRPGAGGAIIEAFREARLPADGQQSKLQEKSMTDKLTLEEVRKHPEIIKALQKEALDEAQHENKLSEAQQEIKKLKEDLARVNEADVLRQARSFTEKALEKVNLPTITKSRIVETLAADPVIKDGKLDEAGFTAKIAETVKTESEYLAKITESGQIKGLGGGKGGTPSTVSLEESEKALESEFAAFGLDKDSAKIAAKGR